MMTITSTHGLEGQSSPASDPSPEAYERQHVHSVYESIAPHFSATRHRPWPLVATFLSARRPGSVGLDIGCGNGKYLPYVPPGCVVLASDRSESLVALARGKAAAGSYPGGPPRSSSREGDGGGGRGELADVCVADALDMPVRGGAADWAVSIAVVHHLSTRARRRAALGEALRCLRPGGEVLVYVWALEQEGSRRGWAEGGEQDLLVPWVMRGMDGNKVKAERKQRETQPEGAGGGNIGSVAAAAAAAVVIGEDGGDQVFQRYYHLYRRGELEEDLEAAGGLVISGGYEKDNWWAIATPRPVIAATANVGAV